MFFKPTKKKAKPSTKVYTAAPPPSLLLAIEKRQIVQFIYDDRVRIVEPHACGVFENGRTVLIGYQIAGASKSNQDPPWRTFKVEEIKDLIISDKVFLENRPDYNPHDERLQPTYAKV